jgi:hypothetical protein
MATIESSIRPEEMTADGAEVKVFRRRLSGLLICPTDEDYKTARAVWNGMIDRRPALIAYCANLQDVIESVKFSRTTGILAAVRSGGHNIAGVSLCDGGLVIDLSRMNRVTARIPLLLEGTVSTSDHRGRGRCVDRAIPVRAVAAIVFRFPTGRWRD